MYIVDPWSIRFRTYDRDRASGNDYNLPTHSIHRKLGALFDVRCERLSHGVIIVCRLIAAEVGCGAGLSVYQVRLITITVATVTVKENDSLAR